MLSTDSRAMFPRDTWLTGRLKIYRYTDFVVLNVMYTRCTRQGWKAWGGADDVRYICKFKLGHHGRYWDFRMMCDREVK